jgi:hypothetical protein
MKIAPNTVIPGRAPKREPGISINDFRIPDRSALRTVRNDVTHFTGG